MILHHRNEFADLIDSLGLTTAAEVGVGDGYFARQLLRARSLRKLYLVDHWPNPADAAHKAAARSLADADGRVEIVELASPGAAKRFADGQLGLVYLDAMHDYQAVKADLSAWQRKAARVLAGHDYVFWNTCVGCPIGVIPAVEEFARERQLLVHVTGAGRPDVVERLKVAHAALFADAGRSAENFPSWFILK